MPSHTTRTRPEDRAAEKFKYVIDEGLTRLTGIALPDGATDEEFSAFMQEGKARTATNGQALRAYIDNVRAWAVETLEAAGLPTKTAGVVVREEFDASGNITALETTGALAETADRQGTVEHLAADALFRVEKLESAMLTDDDEAKVMRAIELAGLWQHIEHKLDLEDEVMAQRRRGKKAADKTNQKARDRWGSICEVADRAESNPELDTSTAEKLTDAVETEIGHLYGLQFDTVRPRIRSKLAAYRKSLCNR